MKFDEIIETLKKIENEIEIEIEDEININMNLNEIYLKINEFEKNLLLENIDEDIKKENEKIDEKIDLFVAEIFNEFEDQLKDLKINQYEVFITFKNEFEIEDEKLNEMINKMLVYL